MSKFVSYLKDDAGASAAEYALILAIVGLGIVAAARFLGGAIGNAMNTAATCIQNTSSC
jgi:pilus assembly protein Flp/PilA